MNHIPKKIVPPYPQCKDNSSQLKIMREIVLFMMSQLLPGICNHTTILHKKIAKPSAKGITINIKNFVMSSFANMRDVVSNFFRV
jgi:hypothetical protein